MIHMPCLRQWFCWFSIFVLSALAADFSKQKEPRGALKVQVDYELATTWPEEMNVKPDDVNVPLLSLLFSSYIKFKEPVSSISDEQLWRLTVDAHREMVANAADYGVGGGRVPGIMTALAVDNELYLTSSIKGPAFTYKISPTPAKAILDECAANWFLKTGLAQGEHGNRGACGEIMASHQYYLLHPNNQLSTKNPPARTTAVRTIKRNINDPEPYLPCFTEKNENRFLWGCREYLDQQKIHDIPLEKANSMPPTIDVTQLAGGIEETRHVTLCSLP